MGKHTLCKDCFYWQARPTWRKKYLGKCHRHAPRPELETWWNSSSVMWPITKETEWCAQAARDP